MDPKLWEQAEELFHQIVDRENFRRVQHLDRMCEGNPDLRVLVEDLLEGDEESRTSYSQAIGRAATEMSGDFRELWIGKTVGSYLIEELIAQGGMGVVYAARRSDAHFEQRVAVKFVTAALPSEELHSRFLSERQILANLSHVNIAQLLDGGETENGVPYLVMEFIQGRPIDKYCDENCLSVGERITLFKQVCAAIDYTHKNLIVHRDIKPSNVLVTPDGVPKLLDFGIAKLLDYRDIPHDVAVTMIGTRLLSPRHASPEQIRGESVTTASDVYSLGILLYELLCGSFPYQISNSTSASDIEATICTEVPNAPSTRLAHNDVAASVARRRGTTPRELRRKLQGDVDTIVMKALRKEPEERYSSAAELADDLTNSENNRPILARPPTRAYLLSRYWRRHRTAAVGIAATLLAIVAGSVVSTSGFFKAKEAERVAILEASNATAISEFLVSLFQEANPATYGGKERSVRELLQEGLQRVDTELANSPLVRASILETLSSVYKGLGNYARSEQLLYQSFELYAAFDATNLSIRARIMNDLSDLKRIQSQPEEAISLVEESIRLHRLIGGEPTLDFTHALNNLALAYAQSGKIGEAGELFERSLALREAMHESPSAEIAVALHSLGWFHLHSGHLDDALRYSRAAADMREQLFGTANSLVAVSNTVLSQVYRAKGNLPEAENAAFKAVRAAGAVLQSGHKYLADALYELAVLLHAKGDFNQAQSLLADVVSWEGGNLGPQSVSFATYLNGYAAILVDLGEYERAEVRLREARRALEASAVGASELQRTMALLERLQAQR